MSYQQTWGRSALLLFFVSGWSGCTSDAGPADTASTVQDGSGLDAGTSRDGSGADGAPDAARTDDASTLDASSTDDGSSPLHDAAMPDAGPSDSGEPSYVRPDPIVVPPLAVVDVTGVPTDTHGLPIVYESLEGTITLDPSMHDPITGFGACLDLVTHCVGPTRSLDACALYVPHCATAQYWTEPDCCPTACSNAYETQRVAGYGTIDAFRGAFLGSPSCFPGLDSFIGGAP